MDKIDNATKNIKLSLKYDDFVFKKKIIRYGGLILVFLILISLSFVFLRSRGKPVEGVDYKPIPEDNEKQIKYDAYTLDEQQDVLCRALLGGDVNILKDFYFSRGSEINQEQIDKYHVLNSLYRRDKVQIEKINKETSNEMFFLFLADLIDGKIQSIEFCGNPKFDKEGCERIFTFNEALLNSDKEKCTLLKAKDDQEICQNLIKGEC